MTSSYGYVTVQGPPQTEYAFVQGPPQDAYALGQGPPQNEYPFIQRPLQDTYTAAQSSPQHPYARAQGPLQYGYPLFQRSPQYTYAAVQSPTQHSYARAQSPPQNEYPFIQRPPQDTCTAVQSPPQDTYTAVQSPLQHGYSVGQPPCQNVYTFDANKPPGVSVLVEGLRGLYGQAFDLAECCRYSGGLAALKDVILRSKSLIQSGYNNYYAIYGISFAIGDDIAARQLRDLTALLDCELVQPLKSMSKTGRIYLDGLSVIANTGCDGTITALRDLAERLGGARSGISFD
ncbi:MAG: hypothetical protein M1829_001668 [Trizodia sp. TS-e1964]|nr:MAG: hypothetical protein M1829_001668 [Trizodia sp. TS-e1964]